jgi:hypothetical protein
MTKFIKDNLIFLLIELFVLLPLIYTISKLNGIWFWDFFYFIKEILKIIF